MAKTYLDWSKYNTFLCLEKSLPALLMPLLVLFCTDNLGT
jgi:hypothetical protein